MEELILTGNLGNDPELRQTQSGKQVANFGLAVNAGKDATGKSITHWYKCEAWERTAEVAQSYLHKGSKVLVRGIPRAEAYTGKRDGKLHTALCVKVRVLEMLSSKSEGETSGTAAQDSDGGYTEVEDDELPF